MFLDDLLCARSKRCGLWGGSECSVYALPWEERVGRGCMLPWGRGRGPDGVVGKGSLGWGNSRSKEFDTGYIRWEHGLD